MQNISTANLQKQANIIRNQVMHSFTCQTLLFDTPTIKYQYLDSLLDMLQSNTSVNGDFICGIGCEDNGITAITYETTDSDEFNDYFLYEIDINIKELIVKFILENGGYAKVCIS